MASEHAMKYGEREMKYFAEADANGKICYWVECRYGGEFGGLHGFKTEGDAREYMSWLRRVRKFKNAKGW